MPKKDKKERKRKRSEKPLEEETITSSDLINGPPNKQKKSKKTWIKRFKSKTKSLKKTKKALTLEEIPFTAVELDERDDGQDIQDALAEMTGQRTVPSVFVKGTHVGGNDDTQRGLRDGSVQRMLAEKASS